jgi:hypothetical protein
MVSLLFGSRRPRLVVGGKQSAGHHDWGVKSTDHRVQTAPVSSGECLILLR